MRKNDFINSMERLVLSICMISANAQAISKRSESCLPVIRDQSMHRSISTADSEKRKIVMVVIIRDGNSLAGEKKLWKTFLLSGLQICKKMTVDIVLAFGALPDRCLGSELRNKLSALKTSLNLAFCSASFCHLLLLDGFVQLLRLNFFALFMF